jgi:hypothetical protein
MKKIVIYPGRFQPMLSHHAEVYHRLQQEFPDADVYLGTSNKVELPDSPFNFKEKQMIAQAHGISADHVLQVSNPYNHNQYPFDKEDTMIIFAVGEKDMDRFPFDNIDKNTGLDMGKRDPNKPAYFQPLSTVQDEAVPMATRGYITIAPTVSNTHGIASASQFRKSFASADEEEAKKLYAQEFGGYNEKLFKLIYNKLRSIQMNEQLNQLRKLAGLPLMESAPVNFGSKYAAKNPKMDEVARLLTNAAEDMTRVSRNLPKDEQKKKDALFNALSSLSSKFTAAADGDEFDLVAEIKASPREVQSELVKIVSGAIADVESGKTADVADRVDDGPASDMPDYSVMDSVENDNEFNSLEEMYASALDEENEVEEAAKPDFADVDGDGDTEEDMKDAAEDEEVEESMQLLRKLAGL